MEEGLNEVYTGDGKGKTTAAVGLLLRAHGRGLKGGLVQFLKGVESGELEVLRTLGIPCFQFGTGRFIMGEPSEEDVRLAEVGLQKAEEIWEDFDVLVLDEISYLTVFHIVPEERILRLVKAKPKKLELVLTGRNMPQSIRDLAALVTVMQKEKHPFDLGIQAREGIEY